LPSAETLPAIGYFSDEHGVGPSSGRNPAPIRAFHRCHPAFGAPPASTTARRPRSLPRDRSARAPELAAALTAPEGSQRLFLAPHTNYGTENGG